MAELTMVEAITLALREELERDPSVVLIGQDIGRKGGVFGATRGLQREFGELRVLDAAIAEVGIAGMAIGAACAGLRPVAEFQFADYIHPAFDQIVNEAATLSYRSNGAWSCPVVFRAPCGAGVHGGLYHSQSVEAYFAHAPGLKVVVPSNPADARGLLKSAIRDDNPVVFLEHKGSYRRERGEVPEGDEVVPLGQARLEREGSDVSVMTYGVGVRWAREAADAVAADGISVEILDLRTVHPFDREAVARTVGKTSRALIVHEANKTMGVGAELAAFLAEELFDSLDAPVMRVAARDSHVPYAEAQERAIVPSAGEVAAAIRRLAAY
ncbi:MAG TPA: alpha-ketoacid dehydrogenase subunit beta [Chloroflexota bacterium]|nr:alpha-ketoacid dehydrogenase subunit beta [Chloroflexota bacterium]